MKKNIYFLFSLFISFGASAQNLVVNPSFENTSSNCANFGGEGFFTDLNGSWDNASNNPGGDSCSSPDLFSACNLIFGSPGPVHMPNSALGYQYSRTGTRHAGIITHESLDEYREYIQGRTSAPLVQGQSYCVSMYVSLGNSVLYASNNIGVYFGNTPYQRNPCPGQTNSAIYVTPQLNYSCNAITDTMNWVRLQWNYVASGGEQYFMIGNFFNNANTTIVSNPGGTFINPYAYYFIDDVSIVASTACCFADLNPVPTKCVSDAPFALTAVGGVGSSCSNISTGTWSGTGVTNASAGTFSPAVAGPGSHTITYTLSCGYSTTLTVNVSACATLSVCSEPNGNLTVSGGTGPYTWSQQEQVEDCSACQVLFPIPPCTFPPGCSVMVTGWVDFTTGTTVTPTGTWPIRVVDNDGGVIEISGPSAVPSCSSIPCELSVSVTDLQGVCGGVQDGFVTVSASGNIGTVTYAWNSTPVQNGPTASGLGAGSYTVTATDQQGCQASVTQVLEAGSITVFAGDDVNICKGESVTLSATGATTFDWSDGAGGTAQGATITFTPSATTTYTVTGTNAGGCSDTDDIIVNVYFTPVVTASTPQSQLCDNAGSITLTGDPSGGSFSGDGMVGDVFNPGTAGVGEHIIEYTYYEVVECPATASLSITVDLCTGISDPSIIDGLKVLPNPTSGFIVLENHGSAQGRAEFYVSDMIGRTVVPATSAQLEGLRLPMDLSALASGQYLLNVVQNDKRVATIRLTKE